MRSFSTANHYDGIAVLIVLIVSPIIALIQNYDDKLLFGSIPMAILLSIPLGVLFTFPLFIYLLAKYTKLAFRQSLRPSQI